jgi:hypothetical protein
MPRVHNEIRPGQAGVLRLDGLQHIKGGIQARVNVPGQLWVESDAGTIAAAKVVGCAKRA